MPGALQLLLGVPSAICYSVDQAQDKYSKWVYLPVLQCVLQCSHIPTCIMHSILPLTASFVPQSEKFMVENSVTNIAILVPVSSSYTFLDSPFSLANPTLDLISLSQQRSV